MTVPGRQGGRGLERWSPPPHLGARLAPDGRCQFVVWAPAAARVDVNLLDPGRRVELRAAERGYFLAEVAHVTPGMRYTIVLDDDLELPDPASRWQPDGVHGPSAVLSSEFPWSDAGWRGIPLSELVIYELHVGTFTPEGTFDAVIPRLAELRTLGITALELMPVAQFPGARNWGYDGVCPFAAQNSYGGPQGLRRLVDAAHAAGLAVLLDVVYNHLGPEGNYLPQFGPYLTNRYHTAWGSALNFDGPGSDEVRAYFLASARQWLEEFHVDGLRVDAVHAIMDHTAYPFLQELTETARELGARLGRQLLVIAESDLGDPRIIAPAERNGFGMDAQWLDDFHHALHTLLTGERAGYYQDFGAIDHLRRAFTQGYVYAGDYSGFRGRRHGRTMQDARPEQFVVFSQNHDQIGNRLAGERLSTLVGPEALKLAAAAVLLSPFVPLIFMGEEYGERAPFPYFVSHTDEVLATAVRAGRRAEFAAFGWTIEPPDPLAEATAAGACLHWSERQTDGHSHLLRLYRDLLSARRDLPALTRYARIDLLPGQPEPDHRLLAVHRAGDHGEVILLLNFDERPATARLPDGPWRTVLDTADRRYGGPGAGSPTTHEYNLQPQSAALLQRDDI